MLAHSQYESMFSSTTLVSQISYMCRFARNVRMCMRRNYFPRILRRLDEQLTLSCGSLRIVMASQLSWSSLGSSRRLGSCILFGLSVPVAIKRRVTISRHLHTVEALSCSRVPARTCHHVDQRRRHSLFVTVPGYSTISIINNPSPLLQLRICHVLYITVAHDTRPEERSRNTTAVRDMREEFQAGIA